MKNLHIPVEHTTLANGLRVVVSPDRSAPVVTVGVYYQIGFASSRAAAAASRIFSST